MNRRRPTTMSAPPAAILAALLIIAAISTAAAVSQQQGDAANGNQERVWATLRNQKPSVIGCFRVRESNCDRYPYEPCRGLLVQALEYRWDGLRPNELKVTDLDHHRVILVDRDVDAFLYALPLDPGSGTLLATVWGTGTTMGVVRVYRFHGDSVKLVFYNGSRFSPQFIVANEATPIPLIMLDRYTGGIDEIRPQETEIWRWDSTKEKFYVAATVPVNKRFEAVAKLEHEAKKK